MDILEIFKAIFIGIIEGITEWLPISSTGHMILADEFIKMKISNDFKDMFLYVIQLGAILAVVMMYFHKLNPLSPRKSALEKKETLSLWLKVIVANIPAAIIGLLFEDWFDSVFMNYQTVIVTIILYGFLFIIVENIQKNKTPLFNDFNHMTYKTAFLIGLFQVLSIIPGTSRSGATILGAIILGCSRYIAAEFSFFLAIPIMFGISFLELVKFGFNYTSFEITILLTGMITAFFVSIFAIKFIIGYVKKHDFKAFGYYRIILGLVLIIYFTIFAK